MQFRLIILATLPTQPLVARRTHNGIYLQCEHNITVPGGRGVKDSAYVRRREISDEKTFFRGEQSRICVAAERENL